MVLEMRRPVSTAGRRSRLGFWAAYAASSVGTGLALPFLGHYFHNVQGRSSLGTALLLGALAAANVVCALGMGHKIDKLGPRPIVVVATVLQLSGYLVLATTAGLHPVVGVVLIGAGNGLFNAGLPALMRGLGNEDEHGHLFSVNYVLINLGLGAGALLGSVLTSDQAPDSYRIAFALNAASYVLLTIAVAMVPAARATATTGPGLKMRVLGDRRLMLLVATASLAMILGFAQLETAAPLLLQGILEAPSWTVGVFVALNSTAVVILQIPLSRLASRTVSPESLPLIMAVVWIVAAAVVLILVQVGHPVAGMFAFAVLFGLGECLFSPSFPVLLLRISPPDRLGSYGAFYSAGFTGSTTIGSVVAVLAIGYFSFVGYWIAMLAGAALLAVLAVRLRTAMATSATAVI
ncbi:MFS transporter [Nocardioides carbamazepini]|uniref:MFS transporter n=1 Tax=Nocardioides carbamazepini TaxID=2854259 RepID=UPI00214A266C|nr:MFS transporter [Nocardioides carbamazepini]MCR1785008.1 MFS transporter [Nocardioides carbamazepini]